MRRLLSGVFIIVFWVGFIGKAQTLNPGDGIRLIFYNISDSISGDYYITEDGSVSFPYLGKIRVSGRNIDSVKEEIYNKYSNLYRNPELTVLALIRVNIFGEVNKPGYYYVTGTDKLADLIAKAGGTTSDANISNITITRNGQEIDVDGEKIIQSGDKLQDMGLQSGDQIYVARKWFSGSTQTILIATLSALTSILVAFIYLKKK
jgi:protein involved in polysaccharide export with SLBB domain